MNLIRLVMVLLVSLFCLGASCSDVKPVLPRALDVAEQLCVLLSSEQRAGLSFREVKDQFCQTEKQLRPFLDYVLRAQKQGVMQTTVEPTTVLLILDAGAPPSDGGAE